MLQVLEPHLKTHLSVSAFSSPSLPALPLPSYLSSPPERVRQRRAGGGSCERAQAGRCCEWPDCFLHRFLPAAFDLRQSLGALNVSRGRRAVRPFSGSKIDRAQCFHTALCLVCKQHYTGLALCSLISPPLRVREAPFIMIAIIIIIISCYYGVFFLMKTCSAGDDRNFPMWRDKCGKEGPEGATRGFALIRPPST